MLYRFVIIAYEQLWMAARRNMLRYTTICMARASTILDQKVNHESRPPPLVIVFIFYNFRFDDFIRFDG